MAGLKLEQRFIMMRVIRLAYCFSFAVACGILFCLFHRIKFDNAIALFLADILFGILLVFYLENSRLHKGDKSNTSEYFQRFSVCFTAASVFAFAVSFFPEYTCPMLLVSFLLTTALDREQALLVSCFLAVQITLSTHAPVEVLACYLFLILFGSILVEMFRKWDFRKYAELIAIAVSVAVPSLFYYIDKGTPAWTTTVFSIVSGILGFLGIHFFYDRLHYRQSMSGELSLDAIVDQRYHLVKEIQKYSMVDYNHAIRTSRIAAHAAASIGAKVKVSAVGGFYYRLGKLQGEPFIENGVRMAEDNCFPREVITILSEYNGEQHPISTIESAIVHITDTLVTKFELMDKTTLSSTWNRDLVIYQTLNEKSSSGIYDDSGLTMNQFIKIREFLAKEEKML